MKSYQSEAAIMYILNQWRIFAVSFFLLEMFFSVVLAEESFSASPYEGIFLSEDQSEFPVNYEKYGHFTGIGTTEYSYIIDDNEGLKKASGACVFPSPCSFKDLPLFRKLKEAGKLNGDLFEHVWGEDPVVDLFVWSEALNVDEGVRLFFMANALNEAGYYKQALKAFYAVLIHFSRSAWLTKDKAFYFYAGQEAISKIMSICRKHPELGIEFRGGWIDLKNEGDNDLVNDIIKVDPGKLVRVNKKGHKAGRELMKIKERRGTGKVGLVRYENGDWQMFVDGKPFVVKGVTYAPTNVGETPNNGSLRNWQFIDDNKNGRIDAPYESWVDLNGNNVKDENEKAVGDFQLLKRMGCNAIRLFHVSPDNVYSKDEYNKDLLRDLYKTYNIRVIMGDFLGAYTIGSGADWNKGTDYTDPVQRERMKEVVRQMVLDHKEEPYVLMWLLGNENNLNADYTGINSSRTNASRYPKEYFSFINEVVVMIQALDPAHPVAVSNDCIQMVSLFAQYAPDADIFAPSFYADKDGAGLLWTTAARTVDRPVMIIEFGFDAYDNRREAPNEAVQAAWHASYWEDIAGNTAGKGGLGNSLGGVIFEWIDEWWKSSSGGPDTQERTADATLPFPDMTTSEEWLGLVSQGDGRSSPFLRQLRPAYFEYKKLWNL